MSHINDQLVLIVGKATTGKSMSLRGIPKPEGVMYLNCEAGKRLPFRGANFMRNKDGKVGFTITDPYQVYEAFNFAEKTPDCHTIAVDSLTYMMAMYENVHVLNSTNTMKAWGEYGNFFRNLMSQYVASSTKNVIFTAHTQDIVNEDHIAETRVKVKGSLMDIGIESFFSTIVATKKIQVPKLEIYSSAYLNITEEEQHLGFKHVFQTKLTRDTINESLRSPLEMWSDSETYIDNNIGHVLNRLHEYYAD